MYVCKCLVFDRGNLRRCRNKSNNEYCRLHNNGQCLNDDMIKDSQKIVRNVSNPKDVVDPNAYREAQTEILRYVFSGNCPLYPNSSGHNYNMQLGEKIIQTLASYQNDDCLRGNLLDTPDTLKSIICSNTLLYHPSPTTKEELKQNGDIQTGSIILGEGKNGRILKLPDSHKIVKISLHKYKDDYENMMKELFVNFVIINEFLHNKTLVPTYGFFLCGKNISDANNPVLCSTKDTDGFPNIFIIQKDIEGQTLANRLKENSISLVDVKKCFIKVISTLITLQNSRHQLTHFDLHVKNIMIDDTGHSKLIDWGMASFLYNGIHYTNYLEDYYFPFVPLLSGAYDLYLLLKTIINHTIRREIIVWADNLINHLFFTNTFLKTPGVYIQKDTLINDKNPDVRFDTNIWLIRAIGNVEEKYNINQDLLDVHSYNVDKLNSYTYEILFNRCKIIDPDLEIICSSSSVGGYVCNVMGKKRGSKKRGSKNF